MTSAEGTFEHGDIVISFRHRPSRQDRKHLVVVFSGIQPNRLEDVDFHGAGSSEIQADMLWIRDIFHGKNAYYLCRNMEYALTGAVDALIQKVLTDRGLSKEQCTLVGFSKGGTAALYYAMTFDYPNVVATVPQMQVGRYVKRLYPGLLAAMTDAATELEIAELDQVLPRALSQDANRQKNVYIVSSRDDPEFSEQLEPFLEGFRTYENFNLVLTNSPLVRAHQDVTRYNLPFILAAIYALTEGVAPRFGEFSNGSSPETPSAVEAHMGRLRGQRTPITNIRKGPLRSVRWFPEGIAIVKGHQMDRHKALEPRLQFRTSLGVLDEVKLGTTLDRSISATYFDRQFCNYGFGGFATQGHAGVDLSTLPRGGYTVSFALTSGGVEMVQAATATSPFRVESTFGGELFRVTADAKRVTLEKRSILGPEPGVYEFTVDEKWAKGELIHYAGTFAVRGIEIREYAEVAYYLVLVSKHRTESFRIGATKNADRRGMFAEPLADYTASGFASMGHRGIDLSATEPGIYKAYISMSHKGSLFTLATGDNVHVTAEGPINSIALEPISQLSMHTPRHCM